MLFTYLLAVVIALTSSVADKFSIPANARNESSPPAANAREAEEEGFSCMSKRLSSLENKVEMLHGKTPVMPPEKEELLDAAISRIDTLELELISTKKVTRW